MSRMPAITVLMAAYNDRAYLAESIDSVRQQTFADFEFLIVDDGSTDGSAEYLSSLRDPRIVVIRNTRNSGLTASLNRGLAAARGRYIARMDADDVCLPVRLERQFDFMEAHPNVGILGTSRLLIDAAGNPIAVAHAGATDLAIRWKCLLGNPFGHPTVMLRAAALASHGLRYDETFRTAQDYELWTRLLPVTRAANLTEPLLRYRLRDGVSRTSKPEQLANHDAISRRAIAALAPGYEISAEDVRELRGRFGGQSVRDHAMKVTDPYWRMRYINLLEDFIAAHRDEPDAESFFANERDRIQRHTLAA